MRTTLLAIVMCLSFLTPARATEEPANTVPGPLTMHSAVDPLRPAGELRTGPPVTSVDPLPPGTKARSSALPPLYLSLAALNVLDVYSTSRALAGGATEANPVMAATNGHTGSALAIKAATTLSTVYLTERLRKTHPVAAIAVMIAANGATAAIVARNLRTAR
jgi:hypothetical protein